MIHYSRSVVQRAVKGIWAPANRKMLQQSRDVGVKGLNMDLGVKGHDVGLGTRAQYNITLE